MKGIGFLKASLLGANSPDHVYNFIDSVFEALQGSVTLGVGLKTSAQYLDAGAWSDGLAIKEYLNVLWGVSFVVSADDKELRILTCVLEATGFSTLLY